MVVAMDAVSDRTTELERYNTSLKKENSALQAKVRALESQLLILSQKRQQNSTTLLSLITIVVVFILPRFIPSPFAEWVMGFGCAILMTIMVCQQPESFRSRSGSMNQAICLVAALWIVAVVASVLPLFKRH